VILPLPVEPSNPSLITPRTDGSRPTDSRAESDPFNRDAFAPRFPNRSRLRDRAAPLSSPASKMRRAVLKEVAKRFPWLANVTLYGCLFAGGDLVHQLIAQEERMDWKHTRDVAIVAISFHGNFNYFWLRALERRFPGKSAGMVFRKLLLDQSFASPLATSVFYTGNRVSDTCRVGFDVETLVLFDLRRI